MLQPLQYGIVLLKDKHNLLVYFLSLFSLSLHCSRESTTNIPRRPSGQTQLLSRPKCKRQERRLAHAHPWTRPARHPFFVRGVSVSPLPALEAGSLAMPDQQK
jgi:hypothetical protein